LQTDRCWQTDRCAVEARRTQACPASREDPSSPEVRPRPRPTPRSSRAEAGAHTAAPPAKARGEKWFTPVESAEPFWQKQFAPAPCAACPPAASLRPAGASTTPHRLSPDVMLRRSTSNPVEHVERSRKGRLLGLLATVSPGSIVCEQFHVKGCGKRAAGDVFVIVAGSSCCRQCHGRCGDWRRCGNSRCGNWGDRGARGEKGSGCLRGKTAAGGWPV
jgi:hypothetical protein